MKEQIRNLPESFKDDDIEEVKNPPEEKNIVDGGLVKSWKRPVTSEKERMRLYITSAVLLFWAIGTTVGLIRYITVGDISVFVYSPAVLMVPFVIILKYYFDEKSD